jgi:4-aminobutyrate aminotransferase-like enzyme
MSANDKSPAAMLALKREYLMPCVYHFYREPMVLERGEGAYLYDTDGRRYLDAYSGVGVVNCGHANPAIMRRTVEQVGKLQHTTTIYLTEPMLRLAEALAQFIPGGRLRKSFFCTSGSEANEGALLLAKLATGRNDFIALSRGLHGRTYLTAGLTGIEFWRTDPAPPSNVHFAPSPACASCPLKLRHPGCGLRCADEVERILERNPGKVAAMIAEPVHGNGGIVVPPPGYFRRVREILDRHGVLLIMDEAQTGFCRTGERFGFVQHGIEPDILTVCKALGNGLPISAFVATDAVAAKYTRPGASTFGGNPVCAATAQAVLDYMTEHRLEQRAERLGRRLRGRLEALAARHPVIAEVRGLGLMLGLELVDTAGRPATRLLDELLEDLKERGVLAGKTGPERNVLTLMPPLVMDERQVDELGQVLAQSFADIATELHTGEPA